MVYPTIVWASVNLKNYVCDLATLCMCVCGGCLYIFCSTSDAIEGTRKGGQQNSLLTRYNNITMRGVLEQRCSAV